MALVLVLRSYNSSENILEGRQNARICFDTRSGLNKPIQSVFPAFLLTRSQSPAGWLWPRRTSARRLLHGAWSGLRSALGPGAGSLGSGQGLRAPGQVFAKRVLLSVPSFLQRLPHSESFLSISGCTSPFKILGDFFLVVHFHGLKL